MRKIVTKIFMFILKALLLINYWIDTKKKLISMVLDNKLILLYTNLYSLKLNLIIYGLFWIVK